MEIQKIDFKSIPNRAIIVYFIELMKDYFFPNYFNEVKDLEALYKKCEEVFSQYISSSEEIKKSFFSKTDYIMDLLSKDVEMFMDSDPACKSQAEIILCYPGFYAILVYRIAHELFKLRVPLIPRMMSEYAHNKTGIDIHPGATIGEYFFIDHGTGIVIGETTKIGMRVKIYQGVTLGALSLAKGKLLAGAKRHPTIGDDVCLYAGASILGGDTIIGNNVTVGSNVFITSSIPDNMMVTNKDPELVLKNKK